MAMMLLLAFGTSLLLTALLIRLAPAAGWIDVPNSRSSHAVPTPRGGGVAFVLVFSAGVVGLGTTPLLDWHLLVALVGAGGLVSAIGFIDDLGHVPAGVRLLVHTIAAIWLVVSLFDSSCFTVLPCFAGALMAALSLVWLTNLYNFMDGIDGIAGIEAMTVLSCAATIIFVVAPASAHGFVPLLLASAVAGFQFWNLPPARIFMGDTGSGFLGIVMGGLAMDSAQLNGALWWSWVILLGAFIVDATTTLIRRACRGERIYQAHRTHAYQHAARRCGAHGKVTFALAVINLCWLMPIALLVGLERLDGVAGVAIAYSPLVWLALRFDAGVPESPGI